MLILKFMSEVNNRLEKYQNFFQCRQRFCESMVEIVDLVVNVDHAEIPKKLPNPNIYPVKRTFHELRNAKLLPPDILRSCIKRLDNLSQLPNCPVTFNTYDELRNLQVRKSIKNRIDFDREMLRRIKEEHRYTYACDNWDKEIGMNSLNEFEIAWEKVPAPLNIDTIITPKRSISVYKKKE